MSDKTAYVLNKDDLEKLKETMAYVDSIRRNKSRSQDSYDSSSPEVYVARVPVGGIPSLNTVVGTGTGDPSSDSPQYAVCNIYEMVPDEVNGTTPEMMIVNNLSVNVYNLSTTAVPADSWVLVARDKYGIWFVTGVVSSGAGSSPGGTWLTLSPVTDVSLSCTSGTLTLVVTKDTGHDYYIRNTP